ncbi:MAG: tripartite tricarboxylate transporter substrate binding protein, partial [Alphaproteobacteria bacterium]
MLRKRVIICRRLLVAGFLAALAPAALAQPYPTRPIKLLVSFPPGGASDVIARLIAQPLTVRLGQPVIVENRPGANGNLAGELAARATPDGTTLLLAPSSLLVVNPHLYSRIPFDPLKDLVPAASVVSNALFLAANPALAGVVDFASFIALAKRSKPSLFYASIGNGSEHHLAMEFLKQKAGIDLIHVPYRGGGPAAIGVMAGDVAAM